MSPSSPRTTVSSGTACSARVLASARAMARSAAGSSTLDAAHHVQVHVLGGQVESPRAAPGWPGPAGRDACPDPK